MSEPFVVQAPQSLVKCSKMPDQHINRKCTCLAGVLQDTSDVHYCFEWHGTLNTVYRFVVDFLCREAWRFDENDYKTIEDFYEEFMSEDNESEFNSGTVEAVKRSIQSIRIVDA